MRRIDRGELRAPAHVVDIDIARPADTAVDVARFESIWCLVRCDGAAVAARFYDVSGDSMITMSDLHEHAAVLASRASPETSLEFDGSLTVVICTRNRSEGLLRALGSLSGQSDPGFDVLIIDNSRDGDVARTWDGFAGIDSRCCHEAAPGLSRARNRALAELRSDHVAWMDDDEVADRDWVRWIKRGFAEPDRPDAVAGVMLPAELETQAQVNFERYGGFNKGRGMSPERLRAGAPSVRDPLYPLPGFGAGGNMAFRTEALRAIGGFDNRLGAGTLTRGGEETRALSQLLDDGSLVLHWPHAVTWHYHRRTDEQLVEQFFGYSAGLTAFYMSVLIASPSSIFRVLGFVPQGIERLRKNKVGGRQPEGPPAGFPEHLLRAGRRGLFQGAWLYVREFARQSRPARRSGAVP